MSYSDGVLPLREGAITAIAFTLCLLGGMLSADDALAAPPAPAYLIAGVSSALLLLRRRAPVAIMLATTVCGMLIAPMGLLPSPLTVIPAVISAYALAVCTELRTTVAVLLPCAALLVVFPPFFEDDFSWEDTSRLATVAVSPLVAAVLGRSARYRHENLAFIEERAWQAEESRESEARRRVSEERVRIARELHDLVAHQITLANAQATVAAHLFDTRPEIARTNVNELVETTRHALDELRATVGLLRQHDDAETAEPAPGLSQLPMLLESFRRAGLEVSMQQDGTARSLPPAVGLTAYRIIQEALTNVTKHATVGSAQVRLTWSRDVTITVSNDGGASHIPPERPPGYGLIGMRERVTAIGGDLTADKRPGGGFLVIAQLPLLAAEDTVGDYGTSSEGR